MNAVNKRVRDTLKKHLPQVHAKPNSYIISQREKRLESIRAKLKRIEGMYLNSMGDIGGVRIVLPTLKDVNTFVAHFPGKSKNIKVRYTKDYIATPKEDGYRSYHLGLNTTCSAFEHQLPIELQIRTRRQHAWATAVEVAGLLQKASFKTGDWSQHWKAFFIAAGHYLYEKDKGLKMSEVYALQCTQELVALEAQHNFMKQLAFTNFVLNDDELRNSDKLEAVVLDATFKENQSRVVAYPVYKNKPLMYRKFDEMLQEQELKYQKDQSGIILRLETNDIKNISKAYPMLFLDTSLFLHELTPLFKYHD
jgi:hypothetical protein